MISPDLKAPHVVSFCAGISNKKPVLVPIEPFTDAQIGDCHNNVDLLKFKGVKGHAVYGWHIYEWPGVFIEAERHTVWKGKKGLRDITPHKRFKGTIVFLPDPNIGEFDFNSNQKKFFVEDSLLYEFINLSSKMKEFLQVGHQIPVFLIEHNHLIRSQLAEKYGEEPYQD